MKILHIWNTAGVPQTLAKYQCLLDHEAKVISRRAFNSFGFEAISIGGGTKQFYIRALLMARKFDLIHVHSVDKIVPILKKIYNKPILLTYHGTDIRGRWGQRKKFWEKADFVSVSTPDLLRKSLPEVEYIANPVDTEHFKRVNDYIPRSALFVVKNDSKRALDLAQIESDARDLELIIQNRSIWIVPYSIYPRFLELFEYYIDIKIIFGEVDPNPAVSYSALQFLALDGKVIFMGKQLETRVDDPKEIAKKWIDIYDEFK